MTTTTAVNKQDRLLRREEDFVSQLPRGAAFYDYLPRMVSPNIPRTYGTGVDI